MDARYEEERGKRELLCICPFGAPECLGFTYSNSRVKGLVFAYLYLVACCLLVMLPFYLCAAPTFSAFFPSLLLGFRV